MVIKIVIYKYLECRITKSQKITKMTEWVNEQHNNCATHMGIAIVTLSLSVTVKKQRTESQNKVFITSL